MTGREAERWMESTYGFFVSPGPDGLGWLAVPTTPDPADGAPRHRRRPLTPPERKLWRAGRLAELARRLYDDGLPVRPPLGWWARLVRWLKGG